GSVQTNPKIVLGDFEHCANLSTAPVFDFIERKYPSQTWRQFGQRLFNRRAQLLALQFHARVGQTRPRKSIIAFEFFAITRRSPFKHSALATSTTNLAVDFVFKNARQPRPLTRVTAKSFSSVKRRQKRILHRVLSLLAVAQAPESVVEEVIVMPANAIEK